MILIILVVVTSTSSSNIIIVVDVDFPFNMRYASTTSGAERSIDYSLLLLVFGFVLQSLRSKYKSYFYHGD